MIPLVALRELFGTTTGRVTANSRRPPPLSQEQFRRPMGSSFPSVRDTLELLPVSVTAHSVYKDVPN
jgi:hypothetical protein